MKSKVIARTGIFIALGSLLSSIGIFQMPQGGKISLCGSLFFVLPGYLFGFKMGAIAGIIGGLVNFMVEPFFLHPVQFLLDYIFAFVILGICGACFYKNKNIDTSDNQLIKSYVIGMFFKFIFHVLSGVIFFGSYAPNDSNILSYSLIYNLYVPCEAFLGIFLIKLSYKFCKPLWKQIFYGDK